MPDSNAEQTSPAEGDTTPQVDASEPEGTEQAAIGGSSDAEATANGGEQPAKRESESSTTPQPGEADAELEAFLKEGSDGEAPTTEQPAEPSQALDPEGEQKAPTPQPPEKDESDPTPEELKRGHVPVKKLTRALEARKQSKAEVEKLTKELQRESAFTDKLLERFDQVGVPPEELATFLVRLHKAKTGDTSARSELAAFIGEQPAADGFTEQEVAAALKRAATETFDADQELAALKAAKAERRKADTPPPRKADIPPKRDARTVDPEILALKAEIAGMGKTLKATHGQKVAADIAEKVETAVQQKMDELEDMGVVITPKVHANAYRKALGSELARRSQTRPAAPRTVRPARLAPPAQPMTADQEFEALQRGEIE
jgi:hypothetical protein